MRPPSTRDPNVGAEGRLAPVRFTVLRDPNGRRMSKTLRVRAPSEDSDGAPSAKMFRPEQVEVQDIYELAIRLVDIASDGDSCIVLAEPVDKGDRAIRRLLHEAVEIENGVTVRTPPTLLDSPSCLFSLDMDDIDDVDLSGLDPTDDDDIQEGIRRIIDSFPSWARRASYVWQLSSTHAFDKAARTWTREGPWKLHLFGVSARPLNASERKAAMHACGADTSFHSAVQLNYLAPPRIIGSERPSFARWGLIKGDEERVPVPDRVEEIVGSVPGLRTAKRRTRDGTETVVVEFDASSDLTWDWTPPPDSGVVLPSRGRGGWKGHLDAAGSVEARGYRDRVRAATLSWYFTKPAGASDAPFLAERAKVLLRLRHDPKGGEEEARAYLQNYDDILAYAKGRAPEKAPESPGESKKRRDAVVKRARAAGIHRDDLTIPVRGAVEVGPGNAVERAAKGLGADVDADVMKSLALASEGAARLRLGYGDIIDELLARFAPSDRLMTPELLDRLDAEIRGGKLRAMTLTDMARYEAVRAAGPRAPWLDSRGVEMLPLPAAEALLAKRAREAVDRTEGSVALMGAPGLGKTHAILGEIRRICGDIRAARPDGAMKMPGSRKAVAVWFALPTVERCDEMAAKAARDFGLQCAVYRGRGQLDPSSPPESGLTMCHKKNVFDTAETAQDSQSEAMCGGEGNRCKEWLKCAFSTQPQELNTGDYDVIFASHAALFTRPAMGKAIPDPVLTVIDEDIVSAATSTTARYNGKELPLRLTFDALERAAEMVEERVVDACLAALAAKETELAARTELARPRREGESLSAWLKATRLDVPGVDRIRRGIMRASFRLSRAKACVGRLRKLATWLRGLSSSGHVLRAEISAIFPDPRTDASVCRSAIRPVLSPDVWKVTPGHKEAAAEAFRLRRVIDLLENVFGRVTTGEDAAVPACVINADSKDVDGVAHAALIEFGFMRPLSPRFAASRKVFIDATGILEQMRLIDPTVEAGTYTMAPRLAHYIICPDPGFGKGGLVAVPEGEKDGDGEGDGLEKKGGGAGALTRRGTDVVTVATMLRRLHRGSSALFTHKEMRTEARKAALERVEEPDGVLTGVLPGEDQANPVGHFGALRGGNDWEDLDACLITAAPSPAPSTVEFLAEARFGVMVGRLPRPGGRSQWRWTQASNGGAVGLVRDHPDHLVRSVEQSISLANTAQGERVRAFRNKSDVFLLGATRDFLGPDIDVELVDWPEIRPDNCDRMLAETGIAVGGSEGRRLFPWLDVAACKRVAMLMDRPTWWHGYAARYGWRVVRGKARAVGRGKWCRAIWLEDADGGTADFAAIGLEVEA